MASVSARPDGTFSRADFVFDRKRNIYVCPGGAVLTSTGNIDQGHIVYYRANKNDCSICSLKPKCTTAVARNQGSGNDRTDARDLLEPPAFFARSVPGMDMLLNGSDLCRGICLLPSKSVEAQSRNR
jgi:hypothetical protein